MDKKFERKEREKPLTDLGKPTKKNKRPSLDEDNIHEKKNEKE
ncbi:hypothetical protein [Aquimarina brevivitae]|uniref:Uncharacterized protein n=1 Tax=Aquimarina brevivitae TaxID=323412 RepID=A0A4Q7PHY5_9FLAO|nr:hypothetical protein [Aquimarina brevivitae]RZT00036.1 hypothetical protein EV197_1266 [Aquimarina brevivitae]